MQKTSIPDQAIRLQKLMAQRGYGARRVCERIIAQGRVLVNGRPAELGTVVCAACDEIKVDGRPLRTAPAARTIVFYKPRGLICAAGAGRTVYRALPDSLRDLDIAGRLDKDSEGLLLLSNDGALVQRLTHPRFGHAKRYRVTVSGTVDADCLAGLRRPLQVEGYVTRPAQARVLKPGAIPGRTIVEFVLHEGRNRQVRRLCERAGLRVHRLVRTAIGNLDLKGLGPGRWRELSAAEIAALAP